MLAQNLKQLRKSKKLTQDEVSKKIGVAKNTYSGYERDIRTPDITIQYKLADLFDVTLDELHGRESKEQHSFKDAKTLMFADKEGWDDLTEEEQNRIWEELSNLADFYIEKEKRAKGEK